MRILKTASYYYRKTTFILYKFKQIKTQRTKKIILSVKYNT